MYKIIGADQKEYGPVTAEQIRQWVAEGRANGQTQVLLEGATEWKPLSAYPEFAGARYSTGAPPPFATLTGTPADSGAMAQILARVPELSIGSCLGRTFSLLKRDFGLLVGATCLIWLVETALMFVPIFGGLVALMLGGVFYGGLFLVYLKRIRGESAELGDAFAGFRVCTLQLFLAGLLTSLLGTLGVVCCLVLPGLYLMVAWSFSLLLVTDRQLEFWSAMELSRKVATRVWFPLFLLLLLVFLPAILFVIANGVRNMLVLMPMMQDWPPDIEKMMKLIAPGMLLRVAGRLVLLVCLPVALGAISHAYEDLFGTRATRIP